MAFDLSKKSGQAAADLEQEISNSPLAVTGVVPDWL